MYCLFTNCRALTSLLRARNRARTARRAAWTQQHSMSAASDSPGMFVQRMNPQTGEPEWVRVELPGTGGEGDASSELVAASSYLDMLTDERRNKAYRLAIDRVIARVKSEQAKGAPMPVVLDIGTGTGLLAMLAARALRSHMAPPHSQHTAHDTRSTVPPPQAQLPPPPPPSQQQSEPPCTPTASHVPDAAAEADPSSHHVFACEVFPPMENLARRVISANHLTDTIRVIGKRSDDLTAADLSHTQQHGPSQVDTAEPARQLPAAGASHAARRSRRPAAQAAAAPVADLPSRVDVVVSEILDSQLLGEAVLPTMRHAARYLLKDTGVAIPASATLWGQLVQCDTLWNTVSVTSDNRDAAPDTASLTQIAHASQADNGTLATPVADAVRSTLGQLDSAALSAAYRDSMQSSTQANATVNVGNGVDVLAHGANESSWQQLREVHTGPLHAAGQLTPLSAPTPLLTLDLRHPPEDNVTLHDIQMPVRQSGVLHGVVVWWQLFLCHGTHGTHTTTHTDTQPASCSHTAVDDPSRPLVISTAPPWVGYSLSHGSDGGPLQGVCQQWRDHWAQCWAPVWGQPLSLACGDTCALSLRQDDISVQVRLTRAPHSPVHTPVGQPNGAEPHGKAQAYAAGQQGNGASRTAAGAQAAVPGSDQHPLPPLRDVLSRAALSALNSTPRLAWFAQQVLSVFTQHMASLGQGTGVSPGSIELIVLGDQGITLPLLAAQCAVHSGLLTGGPHPVPVSITALIESDTEKLWLHAALVAMGVPEGMVCVQQPRPFMKRARHAAAGSVAPGSVRADAADVVVLLAEPAYRATQSGNPWLAMFRLWHDMETLRRVKEADGRKVVCVPDSAVLRCTAASMPDLWRSRCKLDMVEGFDLSAANRVLGVVGRNQGCDKDKTITTLEPLPYVPWQCGDGANAFVPLSDHVTVLTADLSGPVTASLQSEVLLTLSGDKACDSLVFTVEYAAQGAQMPSRADVGEGWDACGVFLLQQPVTTRSLRVKACLSDEELVLRLASAV